MWTDVKCISPVTLHISYHACIFFWHRSCSCCSRAGSWRWCPWRHWASTSPSTGAQLQPWRWGIDHFLCYAHLKNVSTLRPLSARPTLRFPYFLEKGKCDLIYKFMLSSCHQCVKQIHIWFYSDYEQALKITALFTLQAFSKLRQILNEYWIGKYTI